MVAVGITCAAGTLPGHNQLPPERIPRLNILHNPSSRKAVFWVNRRWRRTRATTLRWSSLPLLLAASAFLGSAATVARERPHAPETPLSTTEAQQEPGAAALLDDTPLQVGLKEHGLPEEVLKAAPRAAIQAPPTAVPPPEPQGVGPQPKLGPPAPANPARARLLILDRRQRLLRVLDNGREVRRYPVAVGMPGWETPVGIFSVIEKTANPTWEHPANGVLLPPGPQNPLGSRWIGFYRDCRGRSGFNGQEHLVVKGCVTAGFHGTPNRSSVGRAVSHGCVRLFDEHARELFDLVSLGTPVKVLP